MLDNDNYEYESVSNSSVDQNMFDEVQEENIEDTSYLDDLLNQDNIQNYQKLKFQLDHMEDSDLISGTDTASTVGGRTTLNTTFGQMNNKISQNLEHIKETLNYKNSQ